MGDQNYSCENRTEQLVALFSLYIAVLNGNRKGIIERKTNESEVDAVFGAMIRFLLSSQSKRIWYIHLSIYSSKRVRCA